MKNNFKENLKNLRNIAKLTQDDLAKLLNVSFKSISHWENGYSEPNIDMLIKLKEILSNMKIY